MMKKIISVLILLITISANSQQKNINNYKYIIVPSKFDFVKNNDQYKTSSLTKFLLKKKGFQVFLSNEDLPGDLAQNKCLALVANVLDKSSMFKTKSLIQLTDCFNNIIYTSKEGTSKEKEYKKSYQDAIRKAYSSMTDLKYAYAPLKNENDKVSKKVITPVIVKTKEIVPTKKVMITDNVELPEVKNDSVVIKEKVGVNKTKNNTSILYAQPIENGFQVVNTKPEVVFQLLKTNTKDFFIIKDKNGVLYKSDTDWIAEFYEGNQLVIKKYKIKF